MRLAINAADPVTVAKSNMHLREVLSNTYLPKADDEKELTTSVNNNKEEAVVNRHNMISTLNDGEVLHSSNASYEMSSSSASSVVYELDRERMEDYEAVMSGRRGGQYSQLV